MIISGLRRFQKSNVTDCQEAKDLAAQLFVDIVRGFVNHDDNVALKIIEVFDVRQINLENAIHRRNGKSGLRYDSALLMLEQYIFKFIQSQSYMTAVSLLEHFSIRQSGHSFLLDMLEKNQFMAAEKWAKFMGKPMLCVLVQAYVDRNDLKNAYLIIKKNNLREDFPDVYHLCKERYFTSFVLKSANQFVSPQLVLDHGGWWLQVHCICYSPKLPETAV